MQENASEKGESNLDPSLDEEKLSHDNQRKFDINQAEIKTRISFHSNFMSRFGTSFMVFNSKKPPFD